MQSSRILVIICLLPMLFAPCASVHAGMLSKAVSKVAVRKAAQRSTLQQAERKAVTKSTINQQEALEKARIEARLAAQQPRNGFIGHKEKSQKAYAFDSLRDNALPVKHLSGEREVYRYYPSISQARKEMREGIPAGHHLTATGPGVGRPIGSSTAQERYGLAYHPKARNTVILPQGTPIKQGKVIGGKPGYGEIVPEQKISAEQVRNLHILPQ